MSLGNRLASYMQQKQEKQTPTDYLTGMMDKGPTATQQLNQLYEPLAYLDNMKAPERGAGETPTEQTTNPSGTVPQVDTSDAINSLAELLVTPEQRKQQELALMKQKRNMAAWTGLFDGLRNIGNLYYTTRGATPQQYTDNLYQQNEKEYQNARAISDDLLKHQDNYARQMIALKQRADAIRMKNEQDEFNRQLQQERFEFEKEKQNQGEYGYANTKDGRTIIYDKRTGKVTGTYGNVIPVGSKKNNTKTGGNGSGSKNVKNHRQNPYS